jgi:tripartite ATP-independent transporter DctM subunit
MAINEILVILMFAIFIALLFTGFPIAFVLGGVAMLFAILGYLADLFLGTSTGLNYNALGMLANRVYKLMDNWILVALPMFIFMGEMLNRSGVAESMMKSFQSLFGKVHGALAITVAIIGMILAASTGVIAASVVLLSLLSLPLLLKQGYSKTLAVGIVGASGTLGILIPPSIMLVIMADQLALPVGDLFMGAVFPGVVLGCLYIIYILVYGLVNPKGAPLPDEVFPVNLGLIWEVVKSVLPCAGLIVAVLGSIFMGVATPTEASGVGAFGATLLAWRNKNLTVKTIREAIGYTYNILGFAFGIFIGATCFSLVLRMLGGDEFFGKVLIQVPFGPYGILAIILGVVFILGFFLDWIEICLIILPILKPVISALGFKIEGYGVVDSPELVWFVVLVAICLQTSFLTPPVGFTLFYLMRVAPEVSKGSVTTTDIYRGIVPFVILQVLGLFICILWPQLVVWLPAMAYR